MNIELACRYLSLSRDSVLNYVAAGELPVIRPRRPNVARAWRQRPIDDRLRRLLFDRADLDRLADSWR